MREYGNSLRETVAFRIGNSLGGISSRTKTSFLMTRLGLIPVLRTAASMLMEDVHRIEQACNSRGVICAPYTVESELLSVAGSLFYRCKTVSHRPLAAVFLTFMAKRNKYFKGRTVYAFCKV